MGRSINKPSDAVWTMTFRADDRDAMDHWWYDELVQDVKMLLHNRFGSLSMLQNRWVRNDEHVILENRLGMVILTNYMHLFTVSFVVRNKPPEYENLGVAWGYQTEDAFVEELDKCYTRLVRRGTASNGVSFYSEA